MSTIKSPSGTGYMTLGEVANYFSVSPSTIRRRITQSSKYYDPKFPQPIHFGKLLRFLALEIIAWATNR